MSLEMHRMHRLRPFANSTNCAPSFANIAKIHGSDSFPPEIQNKVIRKRKEAQRNALKCVRRKLLSHCAKCRYNVMHQTMDVRSGGHRGHVTPPPLFKDSGKVSIFMQFGCSP